MRSHGIIQPHSPRYWLSLITNRIRALEEQNSDHQCQKDDEKEADDGDEFGEMLVIQIIDKHRESMAGMSACAIEAAIDKHANKADIVIWVILFPYKVCSLFMENRGEILRSWIACGIIFIEEFGRLFMKDGRQIVVFVVAFFIGHCSMIDCSLHTAYVRFFIEDDGI